VRLEHWHPQLVKGEAALVFAVLRHWAAGERRRRRGEIAKNVLSMFL